MPTIDRDIEPPSAGSSLPDFSNTRIAFQSKSDRELKETARLFQLMNQKWLVNVGSKLGLTAMRCRLPFVKMIIKNTIFTQFCGGVTLTDCQDTIDQLYDYNALAILDYGAESKSDDEDLDIALEELLTAIEFAASNNSVPVVSCKLTSLVDNDVLIAKQGGSSMTSYQQELYERFLKRIDTACKRAAELKVGVMIDAEESWMQIAMDEVVEKMMYAYNRDRVTVFNTYQLYRHDKLVQLKSDFKKAEKGKYLLGAKLVRGAYMDKERAMAKEKGYPSPIQESKEATDADYNKAILFCLDHYEDIGMCCATHNLESVQLMASEIDKRDLPRDHEHLNFCQLQGMSDHLTFNLAQAGYTSSKYVVYGPVKDVMAYLIRRAEENASVTGEMSRELGYITKEMKRRGLK